MIRVATALALVASLATAAFATIQIHWIMGTFLRVVVDDEVAPSAFDGCFAQARALDRIFSRFDPASELVRLNATGGGSASDDFRRVLAHAMTLAGDTAGAFDVSAGAVTALWRRPSHPRVVAVAAARRTVGHVAIAGDAIALSSGTQLDFDGFAKGVAVDACVSALRAAGVERALVSFGESSIYALGAPRGATAWRLDVRGTDPDLAVAELALRDRAAAVSSVYGDGGRGEARRGHIVDPRSGRLLTDDAVAVVVTARAADAEAWAKAVLVGGMEAAERRGDLQAARFGRDGAALGRAMRDGRTLRVLARPRRLGGEVALR